MADQPGNSISESFCTVLMVYLSKEKYDSRARKTSREIEEVEIKLKILKERREAHDSSIEQRIQERMRISEKEIGVIDDKYVSFDDEEEEEEEEELPELSDSMEMEVDDAFISHPSTQILVEGFRLSITRGDLQTLNGLNWLNDEVINFYMNLLMERGQKQGYLKVHAFNTFFYPKLISGGHSALRRWTRKIDLFSMDLILVPVHLGMHWCLAVINFCTKTIAYYDSMGGENKQCLNSLREYLCAEHRDKKKSEFSSIKEWKLEVQQDIPPQMNGSDCGMFTCKYAEYITRGSKITFTQAHMPYFRRRMVWEIIHKQLLQ
ncbi:sentrin-specific protease 1-like [Saccoglossus kowalevskii]